MKEYQKETLRFSVEEEKKVLKQLEQEYKESKNIIKRRIEKLMDREDAELPQVIHQLKWQKAIESEIDDVLNKLKDGTYRTIADYMNESYATGFTSSLYRLQKQGVPLIFPMDREEILRATQLQSKAKGKYSSKFKKAVTVNARMLRNTIKHEVTRGISSSMSFSDVAMNIDSVMGVGLKRAYRIARTEGHRVNQEASFDAMHKAKAAGADIVKQWDSTLDSRTRPHHSKLDGQIRELDDPFEIEGLSAQHPHAFGVASEDINCRCVVLEIARWELDEDETFTKFDGNQEVIVKDLSNVENYKEFRKKHNELFNIIFNEEEKDHYLSDKRFNQLVINAKKQGAIIIRGTEEVEEHLKNMNATASCLGNFLMFRKNVTISEVLEEIFHYKQNLIKKNWNKEAELMSILNEIEAKEYLLKSAKTYKIPRNELERIKKQLDYYNKELEKYYDKKK